MNLILLKLNRNHFKTICLSLFLIFLAGCGKNISSDTDIWVDTYIGEPVLYGQMVDELADVDVVYIGERHTIQRHHKIQMDILKSLCDTDRKILLGLEQLGAHQQDIIDQYNNGQIDIDQMVEKVDWPNQWSNYQDYLPLVEQVHNHGGIIVGLNAKSEIIRKVARNGIDSFGKEELAELPERINTDKPEYKKYLSKVMMVMAHVKADSQMKERMFTAQMCRDEMMAESLFNARKELHEDWLAVVIAGSGHVRNGAGMPDCLRRRNPDIDDRIIFLSSRGEVVLEKSSKAMSRDVTMTHEQFGCFSTAIADYINVGNANVTSNE